eukprot:Rmarinus@m.18974
MAPSFPDAHQVWQTISSTTTQHPAITASVCAAAAAAGCLVLKKLHSVEEDGDTYVANGKRYKKIPALPGSLPVIGNVLDLIDQPPSELFGRLALKYGPILSINTPADIGGPLLVVSDPDLIEEILTRQDVFGKRALQGDGYFEMRPCIGDGILSANDHTDVWWAAHRILMPVFSLGGMKSFFPVIREKVSYIVDTWDKLTPSDQIDIGSWTTRLTFDVIGKIGFGYDFNSLQATDRHRFVQAMATVAKLLEYRTQSPQFVKSLPIERNRKVASETKILWDVVDESIRNRRAGKDGKYGVDRPRDMLDQMLETADPTNGFVLSDENIRYQILTLLFAGHDTTSALLTRVFQELSKNPEVEQKVVEEIYSVLGPDRLPNYEDIARMKYVHMVIKETLRIHPSIGGFVKRALEEVDLGPYHINKNQQIVVSCIAAHRDKRYWGETPDVFNPDNFLPENERERHKYCYLPFSGGNRSCIGLTLATLEAKCAIAMICRRFWLRMDPDCRPHIESGFTTRLYNVMMWVHHRPKGVAPVDARSLAPAASAMEVDEDDDVAVVESHGTPLTIFYGSELGVAESYSRDLEQRGKKLGFKTHVSELDGATGNLPKEGIVLVVSATYNGQPPNNANSFANYVVDTALPENELAGVKYAVFGCGNRNWASTFQDFPKLIDSNLARLGATRVHERGVGDADQDIDSDFHNWSKGLWPHLLDICNIKTSGALSNPREDADLLDVYYYDKEPRLKATMRDHYASFPLHAQQVKVNRELQSRDAPRSTRHIEIQLPHGAKYATGDHLGVSPLNPDAVTVRAAKLLCAREGEPRGISLNNVICLKAHPGKKTPYPTGVPLSLRTLLSVYVDLLSPMNVKMIATMGVFCSSQRIKKYFDELAEGGDLFAKDIRAPRKTILDVLEETPSVNLPLSFFLGCMPALKPRYYSISSAQAKCKDIVHITVGVVDEERPVATSAAGKETMWKYQGVCSNYLKSLGESDVVQVFLKDSTFHLPANHLDVPLILIGPGTGLAPFRAFLQERELAMAARRAEREESGRNSNKPLAQPCYVFFGCRRSDEDYIYREELESYEKTGVITKLYCAFSREGKQKVYVQHKIAQAGKELWDSCLKFDDCHVYVCGDAANMAPDVRTAIEEIVDTYSSKGVGMDAKTVIGKMKALGRYVEDVWA